MRARGPFAVDAALTAALAAALLTGCGAADSTTGPGTTTGGGNAAVTLATSPNPLSIAVDASYVYWGDGDLGAIMKAPLAGGTPVKVASVTYPAAIAVDASYIYVADQGDRSVSGLGGGGSIARVPLAGGTVTRMATNLALPNAIAVDGAKIYFTIDQSAVGLLAIPISGGPISALAGCNPTFSNGSQCTSWLNSSATGVPQGTIALSGTNVFWTDSRSVWSVSKTGGAVVALATGTSPQMESIAVYGSTVYWTDYGSVQSISTTGTGRKTLVTPLNGSVAVTADAANVYYATENGSAHVGRIPLAGGSDNVWATGAAGTTPNGMTSDAAYVYWVGNEGTSGAVYRAKK